MHVEWKIVTDNPQVTRKLKEFEKNVMCMQHQHKAFASDLDYLFSFCFVRFLF